jgi:hypothetical protein
MVSNIFYFPQYMGCMDVIPLTFISFKMVIAPPTRQSMVDFSQIPQCHSCGMDQFEMQGEPEEKGD